MANSDILSVSVDRKLQSDLADIGQKNNPHQAKSLAHLRFQKRRDLIKTYCQNNQNSSQLHKVNYNQKWNEDLWFDYKNQLIFCQISKISSSTWVTNLMT